MRPKILIAASSKTRAKALSKALAFLHRGTEVIVGDERPKEWDSFRLVVCELGPNLPTVDPLLAELPSQAHVILLLTKFSVKDLPQYMEDPRVNHVLRKPADQEQLRHLRHVADKLATGNILGLDRYLPEQCEVIYRRLATYADRCDAIDELVAYTSKKRLRGSTRRNAGQVAEELLMNAMYHAPVDEEGEQLFANISPAARVRRRTPRPVSIRYVAHNHVLYLSVRDRFGSFRREKLLHYLHRCTTQDVQIENKKLGAGLGLYLVTSAVQQLLVNVLPGGVTEVICAFEPPSQQQLGTRVFSFTAQRPGWMAYAQIEEPELPPEPPAPEPLAEEDPLVEDDDAPTELDPPHEKE